MICELKRVISEQFDIYFHLWRDGGANWIREEKQWLQEEEQSWKKISHQKRSPRKVDHGKRVRLLTRLFKTLQSANQCLERKCVHRKQHLHNLSDLEAFSATCKRL
jgi:hypothetical protein